TKWENLKKKVSDGMRAFFYTGAGGASPEGITKEVEKLNKTYEGFEKLSGVDRGLQLASIEALLKNEQIIAENIAKRIDDQVKKFYPNGNEAYTRSLSQQYGLDKALEKTSALSKVLENMKKANDDIETQNRQKQGIFSLEELE